jgi:hypothetical protein
MLMISSRIANTSIPAIMRSRRQALHRKAPLALRSRTRKSKFLFLPSLSAILLYIFIVFPMQPHHPPQTATQRPLDIHPHLLLKAGALYPERSPQPLKRSPQSPKRSPQPPKRSSRPSLELVLFIYDASSCRLSTFTLSFD